MPQNDPYLYPGTNVLINKREIKDQNELEAVEERLYVVQACKPLPAGDFDYSHLKAIHKHLLGELYDWAGEERTIDIVKGNSYFAHRAYISESINKQLTRLKSENYLQNLDKEDFIKKAASHFNELNAAHPFREGNGRTLRTFFGLLAKQACYKLDWTKVTEEEYISANIHGFAGHDDQMVAVFDKIAIPLDMREQIHQLSEATKKELQEYLQYLDNYRQIASKAIQHVGKQDEQHYMAAAKEAKAIYQQKAQTIADNKPLWDELSQNSKLSLENINNDKQLQNVIEKLNNNQLADEEIGLIQTNVKNTVRSLNPSRAMGKGRHR